MNVERTVNIPARFNNVDGIYTEEAKWAKNFICLSASSSYKVQFGQNQPFDASVGVSRDAGPDGIGRLTLTNSGGGSITVTFVLSDGPHESPPNILTLTALQADAQTQGPYANNNMAGGATYTYAGTRSIAGVSRQRKYIEVTNREGGGSGNEISLRDSADNLLAAILPATSRRFDLADDLKLKNEQAGTGIKVAVYEVF